MEIPEIIRVKLSSENAEVIALTPVVVRDMPANELIAAMVAYCGKDPARIRDLFARGSMVSGASRYRWERMDVTAEAIETLLRPFPDPEPGRAFDHRRCVRAIFHGGVSRIEVTREAGAHKGLFAKSSFWDRVLELLDTPEYVTYSYRHRADVYRAHLSTDAAKAVRDAAGALKFKTLESQLKNGAFDRIELHVERE